MAVAANKWQVDDYGMFSLKLKPGGQNPFAWERCIGEFCHVAGKRCNAHHQYHDR
jgi:hypothetical protein